jgi:hypothetical protein
MIPYAQSYTATVRGRFPKFVKCVVCELDYVYLIEREAKGEGTSLLFLDNTGASERAGARAQEALMRKIEKEVDIVPCPACGTIQPDMAQQSRRDRHRWLFILGMVFLPITAILMMITMAMQGPLGDSSGVRTGWTLTAISGLLFVGLPLLRYFLNRDYDPNSEDLDDRLSLGQSRAIILTTFVEMMEPKPSPVLPQTSTNLPDLPND